MFSPKRRSFTASKLWLTLVAAALATQALAAAPGGAEALSPQAAAAVKKWEAAVAPFAAAAAQERAVRGEIVLAMVRADQAARQYLWLADDPALGGAERLRVREALHARLEALDTAHAARLRTLIPPDGWFRNSRDGVLVTHGAWLLLQHSRDTELMEKVLARMERLVRKREVSPHDYALLHDRVSRRKGGKQIYGSQSMCRPGEDAVTVIPDLADPGRVDERRARIGWETSFAETQAALGVGRPCRW